MQAQHGSKTGFIERFNFQGHASTFNAARMHAGEPPLTENGLAE